MLGALAVCDRELVAGGPNDLPVPRTARNQACGSFSQFHEAIRSGDLENDVDCAGK